MQRSKKAEANKNKQRSEKAKKQTNRKAEKQKSTKQGSREGREIKINKKHTHALGKLHSVYSPSIACQVISR